MPANLDQYYSETMQVKNNDEIFKCELCISSASLQELKQLAASFLHPVEMETFSTLTFEKRQFDYLIGKFTSKQAIAQYAPAATLKDIMIDHGIFQYPLISYPGNDKIQVSNSHSKHLCAAIAFSEKHPMAIDIEAINIDRIQTIETQLTNKEKALINEANYKNKLQFPTLFWTIKESLSKVLRTGLTTPFEIFEIKSVKFADNHWISEFENFTQYKVISFLLGDYACSILCPKQSEITINITAIQQWFLHIEK